MRRPGKVSGAQEIQLPHAEQSLGSALRTQSTLSRREWLLKAWPAGVVLLLGTALTITVFVATRTREQAARKADFDRASAQVALSVQRSFDVPLEVVRSIPALFEASTEVTRVEFRAFVRDALARNPWIYALEWIPRVPGNERAKFEAAAVADGFAGYHFKQDAPHGPPVVAEARAEYFPLFYMEPPNAGALGLEETALDVRNVALERARDQGTTAISERLKLVQDAPTIVSVIAFHPVYARGESAATVATRRQSLRGFAAVVFRLAPVVKTALRGTNLQTIDVVLTDIDARAPRNLLYESRPGAARALASSKAISKHVASIAGRRWEIGVADRAGWVSGAQTGYFRLIVGLLASALAAALVYAMSSVMHLRRQVHAARRLGQYTLVEKLGEGGMGAVYRAHHALLRRPTAVKLLNPRQGTATALARFEREVQMMSALTHPNTVVVYDYGHTPQGLFYYAMEYIDGITLQELVDADGAQPPERVVHLLRQMCAALTEAHAIGLVHRDIKPANVMLCNRGGIFDFVKVLDFGLVKELSESPDNKLSQSSTLLGTPHYMAPEAILGHTAVDARVDIYALGAVAYLLLTGTLVFTGGTVVEICAKHLTVVPDLPSERLGRPIPRGLEALVMSCLEKEPDKRPASADELEQQLAALGLGMWGAEEARRWWRERGELVDRHARAARREREAQPSDFTLDVDPFDRTEAPPTRDISARQRQTKRA